MPGFDRSGPMGQGSMTGRAQGLCNPAAKRAGSQLDYGRGLWCRRGFGGGFGGQGRGRAMGRGFEEIDEKQALKNQADQLQSSLERIQRRLAELEKGE